MTSRLRAVTPLLLLPDQKEFIFRPAAARQPPLLAASGCVGVHGVPRQRRGFLKVLLLARPLPQTPAMAQPAWAGISAQQEDAGFLGGASLSALPRNPASSAPVSCRLLTGCWMDSP